MPKQFGCSFKSSNLLFSFEGQFSGQSKRRFGGQNFYTLRKTIGEQRFESTNQCKPIGHSCFDNV